jgi:gas vesicle protein
MKVSRIAAGIVLGALASATLVLLFAPRSGAETRQMIQDRIQSILDEGREAAEARRLELTEQFEALKQPNLPR